MFRKGGGRWKGGRGLGYIIGALGIIMGCISDGRGRFKWREMGCGRERKKERKERLGGGIVLDLSVLTLLRSK